MASIVKRTRIKKLKDRKTGAIREVEVEFWRARYRDATGKEHTKHFARQIDAKNWIKAEEADLTKNTYVDPELRKTTVDKWCDQWIAGYATRRESTVRQAKVHIGKIREAFGPLPLSSVRPSMVRSWLAGMKDTHEPSYVYALHGRLSQIMSDAVLDGILSSNPCSRRTSPGAGSQRPYVATTEQMWGLYDEVGERYRLAVLLGAFAGLRVAECCGLRPEDVVFLKREIHPLVQYPAKPLKTEKSKTPIPVADALLTEISEQIKRYPGMTVLTYDDGTQCPPWKIEREVRRARKKVRGLPEGFRHQDLRHFFASLLISEGADVKVVQHRLRHASAKTTLDTYSHLWPDSDESTRAAVEGIMSQRLAARADSLRTRGVVD